MNNQAKQHPITEQELLDFTAYVKDFYDNQYDVEEIILCTIDYLTDIYYIGQDDFTWGGGDSLDRERVYIRLQDRYVCKANCD